jgi:hypothetical protein
MSTAEQTGPKRKLTFLGKAALAGAVPLGVAIAIYGPALSMVMWHATHWGPVHYRGLRVNVPWGWTADTQNLIDDPPANPQGLMLSHFPLSLRWKGQEYEGIDVNVLLTDGNVSDQQARQSWEELFRDSHLHDGFEVRRPPSALPNGADCLVARPKQGTVRVEWSCISTTNGWMASFAGQPAEVPIFLRIVSGLKPTS